MADSHTPSWSALTQEHASFTALYHEAFQAVPRVVLETTPAEDDDAGLVIIQLMNASLPDFDDIMTLSSKDAHWGALKPLRCAFERTVTLKYIGRNPAEAKAFIGFDALDWKAIMAGIENKLGLRMSEQGQKKLDQTAAEARKRFRQDPCEKCGLRKQTNWTPRSAQELAKSVGLDYMFFEAFVLPTKFIHPTSFGTPNISTEMNPMYNTLKNTNALVVETVLAHQRYFRGEPVASELANRVVRDFFAVWKYADTDFGLSADGNPVADREVT